MTLFKPYEKKISHRDQIIENISYFENGLKHAKTQEEITYYETYISLSKNNLIEYDKRVNNDATECSHTVDLPWEIKDWLNFPYKFYSDRFGNSEMTVLDLACGENHQLPILKSRFKEVISADYKSRVSGVKEIDITKMPEDLSADVIFSFETIEHIEKDKHIEVVNNLLNKAHHVLVIGSVDKKGPTHLGPHEIWKDGKNPFHVAEYDSEEWENFFNKNFDRSHGYRYYQSSIYLGGGQWTMKNDLNGVSNYTIFEKWK